MRQPFKDRAIPAPKPDTVKVNSKRKISTNMHNLRPSNYIRFEIALCLPCPAAPGRGGWAGCPNLMLSASIAHGSGPRWITIGPQGRWRLSSVASSAFGCFLLGFSPVTPPA